MELDRRGCVVQPRPRANRRREEPVDKAKPFDIPKREVWEAFKRVKANQGAAGVDGQSIAEFEVDLSNNLYKLWNRLSSGSYFPPPVRRVEIPKADGGTRPLGIPTVADRIAQEVARRYLEPYLEPVFHTDSYGSEPVVRLSRVYIPGEESVGKGMSGLCVLPARRQSESVDVHQPNSSALGASSLQRQVPAGPGRDVQPVHSRLDQLLQPLLQDAVASDPEEDRSLCHPLGAPQVQAVASQDQGGARLV